MRVESIVNIHDEVFHNVIAHGLEHVSFFFLIVLHKQFWIGKSWKKVGWRNLKM
jgi:hypothetical protein